MAEFKKGFAIVTRENRKPYTLAMGQNGRQFVTLDSVEPCVHVYMGNDKVGAHVMGVNLPIELTCRHDCECYLKRKCYACQGCYVFPENQAIYAETLKAFLTDPDAFRDAVAVQIMVHLHEIVGFRWFTCGDFPNDLFFQIAVDIANMFPEVEFWAYTKKYGIINRYVEKHGLDAIPANLCIIFSHWLNDDGTYLDMPNPYDFPTSEFIPAGKEEMADLMTWVCPCSDPTSTATCDICDKGKDGKGCRALKHGESMALMEHSTSATKARDRELKAAKKALKAEQKKARKAAKKAA